MECLIGRRVWNAPAFFFCGLTLKELMIAERRITPINVLGDNCVVNSGSRLDDLPSNCPELLLDRFCEEGCRIMDEATYYIQSVIAPVGYSAFSRAYNGNVLKATLLE